MRRLPLAFTLVLTLTASMGIAASASADQGAEVETAKQLGTAGLKLYDTGNYLAALAKFDEADTHARVPTLDLFAARCLDKLGRLLDAKARYEDVTRALLPVGSSQKWIDAQAEAKKELDALGARIPTLRVRVTGDRDRRVALSLDGHVEAEPDGDHAVDPGKHTVELVVSGKHYAKNVDVKEGEHAVVEFAVEAEPTPIKAPPKPVPPKGPSALVVTGGVSLALGGAGLIVWGATGGAAMAKASSQHCKGAKCQGDVGTLGALRTASTVGFYVGAPLTLLGGTFLIVSAATGHRTKATAEIGIGRVGLDFSF